MFTINSLSVRREQSYFTQPTTSSTGNYSTWSPNFESLSVITEYYCAIKVWEIRPTRVCVASFNFQNFLKSSIAYRDNFNKPLSNQHNVSRFHHATMRQINTTQWMPSKTGHIGSGKRLMGKVSTTRLSSPNSKLRNSNLEPQHLPAIRRKTPISKMPGKPLSQRERKTVQL